MEYAIEIAIGSEFDLAFTEYTRGNPRRAAVLVLALEAFERDPARAGEFLRGNGARAIYVIPFRDHGAEDGGGFILAELDRVTGRIRPLRFLPPSSDRNWKSEEEWAERFLGI